MLLTPLLSASALMILMQQAGLSTGQQRNSRFPARIFLLLAPRQNRLQLLIFLRRHRNKPPPLLGLVLLLALVQMRSTLPGK
jgi:hypothetical protein